MAGKGWETDMSVVGINGRRVRRSFDLHHRRGIRIPREELSGEQRFGQVTFVQKAASFLTS
jgi:hypothetical protein